MLNQWMFTHEWFSRDFFLSFFLVIALEITQKHITNLYYFIICIKESKNIDTTYEYFINIKEEKEKTRQKRRKRIDLIKYILWYDRIVAMKKAVLWLKYGGREVYYYRRIKDRKPKKNIHIRNVSSHQNV